MLPQSFRGDRLLRPELLRMTIAAWSTRARQAWQSLRKQTPTPLAATGAYDDAEVAAMLRSLGIAMLEVGQPTNLVMARLLTVASR